MTEFDNLNDGGSLAEPTPWISPAARDQLEFDLEFFDQILARNGDHIDVLRQQVELLARLGQHRRALELDRRLVRLVPQDYIARYNLACSLSMVGDVEEAFSALDAALELGYCDWAHLESDADLEAVRDDHRFDHLLAKYGLA